MGRVCCVIDLDETLVHSSFRPIANADFQVPVEIDGNIHQVYVLVRPFLAEFLTKMGELFECILFTASLAKYADEVADKIDPHKYVIPNHRFRFNFDTGDRNLTNFLVYLPTGYFENRVFMIEEIMLKIYQNLVEKLQEPLLSTIHQHRIYSSPRMQFHVQVGLTIKMTHY